MSAPGLYATDRKTAGELKVLADRHGWKARKLTFADLQKMSSRELNFHEQFNAENLKIAMNEPARTAASAKQRIADMWGGKLGPEVDAAAHKAGKQFCEKYPQLIQDETNAWAIHNRMRELGLDGTDEASYAQAFSDLGARGELHLNPSTLGLGTEERISGFQVKNHPQLHLLLRPAATAEQIESYNSAKMSSAEYLKAHPELRDQRMPHYIQERINRAAATFVSMEPSFVATDESVDALVAWVKEKGYEYNHNSLVEGFKTLYEQGKIGRRRDAVVHGQVLTLTEYEPQQRTPPVSDKYSFQKKLDSMSSEEYKDRMLNDKAFRAAVDAM